MKKLRRFLTFGITPNLGRVIALNYNLFLGLSFMFFCISSCKVSETKIREVGKPNTNFTAHKDSIYILCSIYYLRQFDTTYKSKKSPFKSDLIVAKKMVFDALTELYSDDSSTLKRFVLCTEPNQIASNTFIDMRIYVYINWWGLIPMIKVRESVLIKSAVSSNEMIIKSHEEWGFRKKLGEFYVLLDAYGECDYQGYQLKLYCIKKSLNALLSYE